MGQVVEAAAWLERAQLRSEKSLARNVGTHFPAIANGGLVRTACSPAGGGGGVVAAFRHAALAIVKVPLALAGAGTGRCVA